MNIQLLMTGDELMRGDIVDSNAAAIAQRFWECGWQITEKVTVGDKLELLVKQIQRLSSASDLLVINGGLGPTVDDLTAQALATAARRDVAEHPQAVAHLRDWCERRQVALNSANRKQALLPVGADIIPNPVGSAVGFSLELNGCLIVCTPGVPIELFAMLDEHLMPQLMQRFTPLSAGTVKLHTFGLGESSVQQRLRDSFPDWPDDIQLGFRAGMPLLEIKLSIDDASARQRLEQWRDKVAEHLGDYLLEEGDIATEVVKRLTRTGQTITTAESCTGGRIAADITGVAGASAVFDAGFITYANRTKHDLLGVDTQDLEREGAVSETVARQMAQGALKRSGADYAVAVTGIAGPGGGSADKPIGSVWIAWGTNRELRSACLHIPGNRHFFQQMVAAIGLDLIRRRLGNIDREPAYLKRWQAPLAPTPASDNNTDTDDNDTTP